MSAVIAASGIAAGRLLCREASKLCRPKFPCLRQHQPTLRRNFAFGSRLQVKKYTKDHEWVEMDGDGVIATIGISEHAAKALGDIVYVELPTVDNEVEQDTTIGAVESVKSASDILSPISGIVTESNTALEEKPATINASPEGEGWLAKIKVSNMDELDKLMDANAYKTFTDEAGSS